MTTYDPTKVTDVHAALRDYFDVEVAQVFQPKPLKVQYDNQSAKTAKIATTESWVRFAILRGETTQVDMGRTARYRTPGVVHATIFVPKEAGDKAAHLIADAIIPKFRSLTVGGIVVFRTPSMGPGSLEESWWRVVVTCPFYYDYLAQTGA